MTTSKLYINGNLTDHAVVSVDERGFRFGDGIFETIPVFGSAPYLWDYHMERLEAGLAALHIQSPLDNLIKQSVHLIKTNTIIDGAVRIYISRGIGSQGYLPSSATFAPTIIIQTMERAPAPLEAIGLWLSTYEKISPRALPTHCKTAQGLNSTLARMEAVRNNCYDALQLDPFERIAETSSSNIFWLAKEVLHTPSLECGSLAGVTRKRIMELSPYPVNEGAYSLEDLRTAEEVVITNASAGIIAVKSLQPAGFIWKGDALAKQLINLRNQDIGEHTLRLRELLA